MLRAEHSSEEKGEKQRRRARSARWNTVANRGSWPWSVTGESGARVQSMAALCAPTDRMPHQCIVYASAAYRRSNG